MKRSFKEKKRKVEGERDKCKEERDLLESENVSLQNNVMEERERLKITQKDLDHTLPWRDRPIKN